MCIFPDENWNLKALHQEAPHLIGTMTACRREYWAVRLAFLLLVYIHIYIYISVQRALRDLEPHTKNVLAPHVLHPSKLPPRVLSSHGIHTPPQQLCTKHEMNPDESRANLLVCTIPSLTTSIRRCNPAGPLFRPASVAAAPLALSQRQAHCEPRRCRDNFLLFTEHNIVTRCHHRRALGS